jgi:hypothetical protein
MPFNISLASLLVDFRFFYASNKYFRDLGKGLGPSSSSLLDESVFLFNA